MTSTELKLALMTYYRFKRQMLCATESFGFDVAAIDHNFLYEIECKITKRDMWHGEAVKNKHSFYKNQDQPSYCIRPNKFSMCVPPELIEEALKWSQSINEKYGVIKCEGNIYNGIKVIKKARLLHNRPMKDHHIQRVMLRICAENIGLLEREFSNYERQKSQMALGSCSKDKDQVL